MKMYGPENQELSEGCDDATIRRRINPPRPPPSSCVFPRVNSHGTLCFPRIRAIGCRRESRINYGPKREIQFPSIFRVPHFIYFFSFFSPFFRVTRICVCPLFVSRFSIIAAALCALAEPGINFTKGNGDCNIRDLARVKHFASLRARARARDKSSL